METVFYINLNLRTANGYQQFARYYIGNNPEAANILFRQLKGNEDVSEDMVLQLDFIETVNDLPVNLQVLGCTLSELSENCAIITREVFKAMNMDGRE